MKKIVAIILTAVSSFAAYAQNPYEVFGYNSKVNYDESKQDLYRVANTNPNDEIKFITFNFDKKIVELLDSKDSIIQTLKIDNEKLLRWLSVDPKSSKYPNASPYNFVLNNPTNAIDPDGRDVVFLIDKEGASGKGHMGMLFQDKSGGWNYFTQGAAENGSFSGFVSGSNYTGGVGIMPMQTVTSSGDIIKMTKAEALAFVQSGSADGTKYDNSITLKTTSKQDGIITSNAYSLQSDFRTKKEEYNVYTNNCTDAVQDVVEGAKGIKTGITLPTDVDPRPNEYFKQLQSAVPFLNGDLKPMTIPSTMDNFPAKQIVVPTVPKTP